jgi:hypothetical protein
MLRPVAFLQHLTVLSVTAPSYTPESSPLSSTPEKFYPKVNGMGMTTDRRMGEIPTEAE